MARGRSKKKSGKAVTFSVNDDWVNYRKFVRPATAKEEMDAAFANAASGEDGDLGLVCVGGDVIWTHRAVLCPKSEVLRRLVFQATEKSDRDVVFIQMADVDSNLASAFISLVYRGELLTSDVRIRDELAHLASMLKVSLDIDVEENEDEEPVQVQKNSQAKRFDNGQAHEVYNHPGNGHAQGIDHELQNGHAREEEGDNNRVDKFKAKYETRRMKKELMDKATIEEEEQQGQNEEEEEEEEREEEEEDEEEVDGEGEEEKTVRKLEPPPDEQEFDEDDDHAVVTLKEGEVVAEEVEEEEDLFDDVGEGILDMEDERSSSEPGFATPPKSIAEEEQLEESPLQNKPSFKSERHSSEDPLTLRCLDCKITFKRQAGFREHFCGFRHFGEELKKFIVDDKCSICGFSGNNVVRHIGSVHKKVDPMVEPKTRQLLQNMDKGNKRKVSEERVDDKGKIKRSRRARH